MGNLKCPCDNCKRANAKKPCDIELCQRWQIWFVRKWEATCKLWKTILTEENC